MRDIPGVAPAGADDGLALLGETDVTSLAKANDGVQLAGLETVAESAEALQGLMRPFGKALGVLTAAGFGGLGTGFARDEKVEVLQLCERVE